MEIVISQTIFSENKLKVKKSTIEGKDYYGVYYDTDNVIILPYTSDASGIIQKIGLIKEINPFRKKNESLTVITGTEKDEDDTYIDIAKRELYEQTEYKVENNSEWIYLGKLTLSKDVESDHPCFMVNFNTIESELKDDTNKLSFLPISHIQESTDGILLSMVMKYLYIFNQNIKK